MSLLFPSGARDEMCLRRQMQVLPQRHRVPGLQAGRRGRELLHIQHFWEVPLRHGLSVRRGPHGNRPEEPGERGAGESHGGEDAGEELPGQGPTVAPPEEECILQGI